MKSTIMIQENLGINSQKTRIHTIQVEDGNPKGGWYRQVSASEGMIERSTTRWYDFWYLKKTKTHNSKIKYSRWRDNDETSYNTIKESYIKKIGKEKADEIFPELERMEHDSVWDFFDSICYDYKNKKIKNTDTLIFISKK